MLVPQCTATQGADGVIRIECGADSPKGGGTPPINFGSLFGGGSPPWMQGSNPAVALFGTVLGLTPANGPPNSGTWTKPWQYRVFGPDGRAATDYDWHKGHEDIGNPHAHDWDWSQDSPRQGPREIRPGELFQTITPVNEMIDILFRVPLFMVRPPSGMTPPWAIVPRG
jgi:hypothetical protein